MPRLRSPSGAPVPASAAPMSKMQPVGGTKVARIQRSTGPANSPATFQIGGASTPSSQREIAIRPSLRSTPGGVACTASLPSVSGWT